MLPTESCVLVTGAAGFVGVNVVKYLAQRKRRVLALDFVRNDLLVADYLKGLDDYVEWVEVDLTDSTRVLSLASRYKLEGIIHAAIFTGVTNDAERVKPKEILTTNLMGTINTLELARVANVRRYVYVSSGGVYGTASDLNEPVDKDSIQCGCPSDRSMTSMPCFLRALALSGRLTVAEGVRPRTLSAR